MSSPITRLAVETELQQRDAALLTFVGLTPVAATGSTPAYTGAIGFALKALGYPPATPGSVVDSDLLNLDPARFYDLCDLAEFRLIKTALMNFVSTDEQSLDRRQAWNEMAQRFTATMNALTAQYAALLNIRVSPTASGPPIFRWPTPGNPDYAIGLGRVDH